MKVVFDTHVFVSVFLVPGSQGEQTLRRYLCGLGILVIDSKRSKAVHSDGTCTGGHSS
ncbi:MAG: hypothetical protein AB7G48_16175 [Nitrospiraceae bacterium]